MHTGGISAPPAKRALVLANYRVPSPDGRPRGHHSCTPCCPSAPAHAPFRPAPDILHTVTLSPFPLALQSPVRRITPTYFSDRTPTITQEQSQRIVEALKQIGLLGEQGWLLANPKVDDVSGGAAQGRAPLVSTLSGFAPCSVAWRAVLLARLQPWPARLTCGLAWRAPAPPPPPPIPHKRTHTQTSTTRSPKHHTCVHLRTAGSQDPRLQVDRQAADPAALADAHEQVGIPGAQVLAHPAVHAGGLRYARRGVG